MRITIVLVLFSIILFSSCNIALANENDIGQSKIYPTHPLYFLKSFREILELKFAPNKEIQAIRYLEFAQRRIREVKALVEARRADLIAPTLERYIFNLHKALDLTDFKNEAKIRQLTEIVSLHVRILDNIYSQIESQPGQRSIRTTMFKISEWSRQSKICDFLIKEASSSALNEVEIEVLKERAQKCLQGLK